ncbi:MAG: outer membrane lipoprotein carrier protein LolA [Nitrospinae bacterium]|nr:outer membrane lipoprotein carrier protein LolA [Nitrospinota bacterium]
MNQDGGLTREGLLLQLKDRFDNIQSYQCNMSLKSFKEGHQLQNQVLWYRRAGYIRIEQKGPFRKGAVVVIHPDGNIRGHLGGWLSVLTVTLKPDDPRLLGVTGDSALTADYGSIIKSALEDSQKVKRYKISKDFIEGRPIVILESFVEEEISLYRMIIDAEDMLIVQIERYKGDKLISAVSWKDIQINIKLSDELFKL